MKGKWQRITKKIFASVLTLAVAITAVNLSPIGTQEVFAYGTNNETLDPSSWIGASEGSTSIKMLSGNYSETAISLILKNDGTFEINAPSLVTGFRYIYYIKSEEYAEYNSSYNIFSSKQDCADMIAAIGSKYDCSGSGSSGGFDLGSDGILGNESDNKYLNLLLVEDKDYSLAVTKKSDGSNFNGSDDLAANEGMTYGWGDFIIPYGVLFNTDSHGTAPDAISYDASGNVILPEVTQDKLFFTGWFTQASGGKKIGGAGDRVTWSEVNGGAYANTTLYAQYRTPETFIVTASTADNAKGTASGGGNVTEGKETTVTATANKGYHFSNWTLDGQVVSSNPSYTFTPEKSCELVAVFSDGDAVNVIGNVEKFINVDITWGSMAYQYDYKGKSWSIADDANKLSITNHSNVAINAGLGFVGKTTSDSTIVTENISADFRDAATAGSAVTGYDIPVGWGIEGGKTENAWLNLTGGAIKGAGDIGMITVTIASSEVAGQ